MSNISRRTFVTTGASILATGASFMMLRSGEAAMHDRVPDPVHEHQQFPQSSGLHTSADVLSMEGHHMNEEMRRCLQLCHECHAICIQMIGHCLGLGGRHATPDLIGILMDCAQICTTTADYMARGSSFHDRTCGLCAEICRLCAERCDRLAGDDQMVKHCAELCRRCAESCAGMTSKAAT
ncbi:MAG: four-helix bundle copper-binding protein [Nitrospira sp.]